MFRKILAVSLIVLHCLTQSAWAFEFHPIIQPVIVPVPVNSVQVSFDILKNKNPLSAEHNFLFFKISDIPVNQPLVNSQGLSVSLQETTPKTLSNRSGWRLTGEYRADSSADWHVFSGNPSSDSKTLPELLRNSLAKSNHSSGFIPSAFSKGLYAAGMTSYVYDERDKLFTVTDANVPAGVTKYDYDLNGNLAKITDANLNPTTYSYDLFDRTTTTTFTDLSAETLEYDKNSNLTKHTRPNAKVIDYAYDVLNRLTGKTYPQNATLNTTLTYDLGGRVRDADNGDANIDHTYDALNRVDIVTQTIGSLAPLAINYDYDKVGNRTKVTYPSGKLVDYTYDGNNRMDFVKVNTTTLSDYTYDPLGRRISKVLPQTPNNLATTYQYDIANQLAQIKNEVSGGGVISQYDYTLYDNVGNRKTLQFIQGVQPQQTINYVYNNIHELTSVSGGQTHSYDYDGVANREIVDSVTYTANNLNQYTNVGGTAHVYELNGNLTNDGTNAFDYDEDNRLRLFNAPGTANDAVYSYDAFNRRVSKTVNGLRTYFVNDGDREIEERSSAGTLLADYVFGDSIDEVLAMQRGANTYYYHYDGLGSVTELTDSTGAIQESYQYDPYGQTNVTNSAIGNPFQFTGRRLDEESGIYFYRRRYYDPKIGRFLQRDPAGTYDHMNLYAYTGNDPINFIDPFGLYSRYDFLRDASNFSAGFGDFVSFGTTNYVREKSGFNNVVNKCSGFYKTGEVAGFGSTLALSGAGILNAGTRTVLYAGGESALNIARAGRGTGLLLENTIGGKLLGGVESGIKTLGGKGLPKGVWDTASGIFAANAKGAVKVFLSESAEYSSTFYRVEAPIIETLKSAQLIFY